MRRISLSWRTGLWLMLAPFLLGTLLLVACRPSCPACLAFTSYDALSPPVFVGFANFRQLVTDPMVTTAFANSLLFVLLAVPLRVLGALALALLLSGRRRGASWLPGRGVPAHGHPGCRATRSSGCGSSTRSTVR